jgi:hypothetical protein
LIISINHINLIKTFSIEISTTMYHTFTLNDNSSTNNADVSVPAESSANVSATVNNDRQVRGSGFRNSEIMLLIEVYGRNNALLESASNALQKQQVWNDIVAQFNQANEAASRPVRTKQSIENKWERLCRKHREEFRARQQTGTATAADDDVYNEMHKLLYELPTTNPPFRYSSHTGILVNNFATDTTTDTTTADNYDATSIARSLPTIITTSPTPPPTTTSRNIRPRSSFESDYEQYPATRRRIEIHTSPLSPSPPSPPSPLTALHVSSRWPGQQRQHNRGSTLTERNEAMLNRVFNRIMDRQDARSSEQFDQLLQRQDRLDETLRRGFDILERNSRNIEQLVAAILQQNSNDNNSNNANNNNNNNGQ